MTKEEEQLRCMHITSTADLEYRVFVHFRKATLLDQISILSGLLRRADLNQTVQDNQFATLHLKENYGSDTAFSRLEHLITIRVDVWCCILLLSALPCSYVHFLYFK